MGKCGKIVFENEWIKGRGVISGVLISMEAALQNHAQSREMATSFADVADVGAKYLYRSREIGLDMRDWSTSGPDVYSTIGLLLSFELIFSIWVEISTNHSWTIPSQALSTSSIIIISIIA